MQIRTLSTFAVFDDAGKLTASDISPKLAELFCYILLCSPRLARRSSIIEDVFPQAAYGMPRNAMNTALSRLRAWMRGPEFDGLLSLNEFGDCIRIEARDDCETDAFVLEETAESRCVDGAAAARALALYRGPFLAGHDAYWVLCKRARLQDIYVDLLKRKVRLALDREDLAGAMRTCEEILLVDPYQEHAHLGLMVSLAGTGQRLHAIRNFYSYRSVMRSEMGMDVLPGAVDLAQDIIAGSFSRSLALRYMSDTLF